MQRPRSWIERTILGSILALSICLAGGAAAQPQPGKTQYKMPAITPAQFARAGSDSLHLWAKAAAPAARDRARLTREVRKAIDLHTRFQDRVATIYPKDQLEWLLVTDEVADTLAASLSPLVNAYAKANPTEVLSEGRQFFELELAKIPGPPGRLHGFNLYLLANWAYVHVDSLLAFQTKDQAGLEDGALRYLREWCHLYDEVHKDPFVTYETRINQEDWVIARLKSNCGTSKWSITEQYFAIIGTDSTKTPPEERYAHEFHLKSNDCDDKRVITIELPNFAEVQREWARRIEEDQRLKKAGNP